MASANDTKKQPDAASRKTRAQREKLAAALRSNLRRRKEAARASKPCG